MSALPVELRRRVYHVDLRRYCPERGKGPRPQIHDPNDPSWPDTGRCTSDKAEAKEWAAEYQRRFAEGLVHLFKQDKLWKLEWKMERKTTPVVARQSAVDEPYDESYAATPALPNLTDLAEEAGQCSDPSAACEQLQDRAKHVFGLQLPGEEAQSLIQRYAHGKGRNNPSSADIHTSDWPEHPDVPRPPVPDPFPADVLPRALREHVLSVAGATQTPSALGGMLALAAVSASLRGRIHVDVDDRGWSELVTIYTVPVAPPAARKSSVYAHMVAPLETWEREEIERVTPSHRRAKDRAEAARKALEVKIRDVANGKATPDELEAARRKLDEAEAAVPPLPRLLTSDSTPEGLVRLMAEQGGPMAVMAPEADVFGIIDGRYDTKGGPRIDELLKGYNGETIRVDRKHQEPVVVQRPALTVAVTVQPAVLDGLANAQAFRGRGLMGRILWAVPPHGIGHRATGRDVPPLDRRAADRYAGVLGVLLDASRENADGADHALRLTEEALEALYRYEAELEHEELDGNRLAGIQDWAGKAHGHAVRLAALLELAARAEDGRPLYTEPVGEWAMSGAITITRALTTHALALLGELKIDRRTADLRYVLRRASELRLGRTLRDLHNATREKPGLETMDGLRAVVDVLVERGCMRLVSEQREGPGRPSSPVVELHPALTASSLDSPPQNPHNRLRTTVPGDSVGSADSAGVGLPPVDVFSAAEGG